MKGPKKLIEVGLPLEAINRACAREKSIRHGHPSTLHLWWSRKPLAACRAVIFATLVDDPSSRPEEFPTEREQVQERERLFRIIEELVHWENTGNEEVLTRARAEIARSTRGDLPPLLDPFCGGGSIPLEGQRLGLEAWGNDLNPVAVLITKALIEIPPKFARREPVNPRWRMEEGGESDWPGASGLAADIRYYGRRVYEKAWQKVGHLYPQVEIPGEGGSHMVPVIAWLYCRTITCPTCRVEMPLANKFWLARKKGKRVWAQAYYQPGEGRVRFRVRTQGYPPPGTVSRRGARCLACGSPVSLDHIRQEGRGGGMACRPMAVVAQGRLGRVYVDFPQQQEEAAGKAVPSWLPRAALPNNYRDFKTPNYGLVTFAQLFTPRQLLALDIFCQMVAGIREEIERDARAAGLPGDHLSLAQGGRGARAYAEGVTTYLAFALGRLANRASTISVWNVTGEKVEQTFARQAIPMTWDFAEANVFSRSTGSWLGSLEWIPKVVELCPAGPPGFATQQDSRKGFSVPKLPLIFTDPPYYDNISYAQLADYFYIWLRRSLAGIYPHLLTSRATPKAEELVVSPATLERDQKQSPHFFESGLKETFLGLKESAASNYPLVLFYAFKQAQAVPAANPTDLPGWTWMGWETMLTGLLEAGFSIKAAWPVQTERPTGVKAAANVLASSILLVCRPRREDAPLVSRREFTAALRRELPAALAKLQEGNLAPVDLAQGAIGSGMALFTRYQSVLEDDGRYMSVGAALQLINQEMDSFLRAPERGLDAGTRYCLAWFAEYGLGEGTCGKAHILAQAMNTAVKYLMSAGVLTEAQGKVRLLTRPELKGGWLSETGGQPMVWLCTQHLVWALETGGEAAAAKLAGKLGDNALDGVKSLAYRLFALAEKKGLTGEARAYNRLVTSWSRILERVDSQAGGKGSN